MEISLYRKNSIVLVEFEDRDSMCKTLLRPQEFWESPVFKNKIFTLGQYRKNYIKEHGIFNYSEEVAGCNVPSIAFKPFIEGLFDPLTPEEEELINYIKHKKGKFCVIGIPSDYEDTTLDHEMCHAYFYLDYQYRRDVIQLIVSLKDKLDGIKEWLVKEKSYSDNIILLCDEINSFIAADHLFLKSKKVKIPRKIITEFIKLKMQYVKYKWHSVTSL